LLNRLKRLPFWLAQSLVLIVTLLIVGVLHHLQAFERLNQQVYDTRLEAKRQDVPLPEDIALILIDEASLQALEPVLGRFPWPRSVYADLAEFLAMGNARAVLFDILLTEREGRAEDALSDSDQRLVVTSWNHPNLYHSGLIRSESIDEGAQRLNRPMPDGVRDRHSLLTASGLEKGRHNHYSLPFDALLETTPNLGIVGVEPDRDGVYRRLRLLWEYHSAYYPALSLAPLLDEPTQSRARRDGRHLFIDGIDIPIGADEQLLLNYYGEYRPYSMAGVLDALQRIRNGDITNLRITPDEFENKLVYIGASAVGLDDIKTTPMSQKTPGVFIHATATGNLMDGQLLHPPNAGWTYLALVLISTLTLLAVARLDHFSLQLLVPLGIGLGYAVLADVLLSHNRVTDTVTPLAGLALTWMGSLSHRFFVESSDKRRIKRMLSQYVSPSVLTDVLNRPDEVLHAQIGVTEHMTVMFSDVRNFTGLSENLAARDIVQLLNCHFAEMSAAIFEFDGTVDKFIGDALMAFWGAPIRINNHADLAVSAALRMVERLDHVNEQLEAMRLPQIDIGIGLNSGDVILGNIGSDQHLDYTVIGDNVNLASRVEGLTKTYGLRLLISESTHRALTLDIPCVPVDRVQVKGRQRPVDLFAPWTGLNPSPEERADGEALVRQMTDALACYYDQRWEDALDLFSAIDHPGLRKLYRSRCWQFQRDPPGKDWAGVYTATSK